MDLMCMLCGGDVDDVDFMCLLCGGDVDDVDFMCMLRGGDVDDVDFMCMLCGGDVDDVDPQCGVFTSIHWTNSSHTLSPVLFWKKEQRTTWYISNNFICPAYLLTYDRQRIRTVPLSSFSL